MLPIRKVNKINMRDTVHCISDVSFITFNAACCIMHAAAAHCTLSRITPRLLNRFSVFCREFSPYYWMGVRNDAANYAECHEPCMSDFRAVTRKTVDIESPPRD